MIKILANDGISQAGIDALKTKGFDVITEHVPQNEKSKFSKAIKKLNKD